MNIMGLWTIIFSAVVLAQIIGAAIGTLVMSTKWYRKWVMKVSMAYTEDVLGITFKQSDEAKEDEITIEKIEE